MSSDHRHDVLNRVRTLVVKVGTNVLSTDDDRVALILLRAGSDPHAHNDQGTLRQQATKNHMPATLAWLDAHGVP